MSDRWNLILGVVSSAWSAVIALAVVPVYLRFLGIEAYGLIGFFIALQALFGILDLGLSATISREVARCRASGNQTDARNLLHTLAIVYWVIACLIGASMFAMAAPIAHQWLRDTSMPVDETNRAIQLMGIVIAFRWPIALYSGALIGAGRLAYVSILSLLSSTISNVGAVLILWWISPTIEAFLAWQAGCTIVLLAGTALISWREMGGTRGARFDGEGLKRIWRFSAGLSIAAIIGTVFMQSDKVVLSRMVSLEQLGRYVLAGTVARALYILLTPAFNVIYPRMTALVATGSTKELVHYYRFGTRILMAGVIPCSTFAAYFARDLLGLWTGSATTADAVAPLVPLMVAGTAMNGVMHFPYALQLASGRASLPAAINLILLTLFVPMLIYFISYFGVWGGGLAWALLNLLYILIGTWLTHRVILPGLGPRWLLTDVAVPGLAGYTVVAVGASFTKFFVEQTFSRLAVGLAFTFLAMITSLAFCRPVTAYVSNRFRRLNSAHY